MRPTCCRPVITNTGYSALARTRSEPSSLSVGVLTSTCSRHAFLAWRSWPHYPYLRRRWIFTAYRNDARSTSGGGSEAVATTLPTKFVARRLTGINSPALVFERSFHSG